MLVVRFKGIADRNAAEALNGIELTVPRDRLPPAGEDEFYHADLIGLAAVTVDGARLGTVIAVENYGAGDLLEIAPRAARPCSCRSPAPSCRRSILRPGRVVVDPPRGAARRSRTTRTTPRDLRRHRPHHLPRDVSRAARRQPRRPGAGRGHLVAGGPRHPRLGHRQAPFGRRYAGRRRAGHGDARRRARRGDRRRAPGGRRPAAAADEPARPAARLRRASARSPPGDGVLHRRRAVRGRRRAGDRGARAWRKSRSATSCSPAARSRRWRSSTPWSGCCPASWATRASAESESFADGLLEYPQYTRPAVFEGRPIPEILTSGDHGRIADGGGERRKARDAGSPRRASRPDLLARRESTKPGD